MFDLRELPGPGDLLCLDRYPMAATLRKYFWPLTCSWLSCPGVPILKLQTKIFTILLSDFIPMGKQFSESRRRVVTPLKQPHYTSKAWAC